MTAIEAECITVRLGGAAVLEQLSARFAAGQVTALVGPNGAGKSTLLRALAGLVTPQAGRICLDGDPLAELDARERARRIAYLPPDGRAAWPMPARRIVALGRVPFLKPLRQFSEVDEAAINGALERTGMTGFAERAFDTLSSGEKARILLARALASEAPILLLDEPTAALDPQHQLHVMEIARKEAERGACVVLSVHALDLAATYADQVVVLHKGRVHSEGTPKQALSETVLRDVFGVLALGGIQPSPLQLAVEEL